MMPGACPRPSRRPAPRGPLLAHLTEPTSAAGLARRLGQPRQRLNYHLRAPERRAGLIECVSRRRKGNRVERLMRVTRARDCAARTSSLGRSAQRFLDEHIRRA